MKKLQYLNVSQLACHIWYFKIAVTSQDVHEHFHGRRSRELII